MGKILPLKIGDRVAVISPSGKVDKDHILTSTQLLKNWGLEVIYGEHTFDVHHKLAGKDEDRLKDLQWALDDHNIKAIFCSRGGYGLVRIIDELNWSKFTSKPKLIIGFSDVTVLHNELNKRGFNSIHAVMPNSYHSSSTEVLDSLRQALFYEKYQFNLPLFKNYEVVGGNLAIIYSLLGTNSDIDTHGKVLFIEDIGEYAYVIDRMMHALKKAGKLDHLKGLVLGHFTNIKEDDFGYSVRQIVERVTAEFDYPIVYDVPIGHEDENYTLALSKKQ